MRVYEARNDKNGAEKLEEGRVRLCFYLAILHSTFQDLDVVIESQTEDDARAPSEDLSEAVCNVNKDKKVNCFIIMCTFYHTLYSLKFKGK